MDERDFKKLLIDLDLSRAEIARKVRRSSWAVTLYFRGALHCGETRKAIKGVLRRRAKDRGVTLPAFWPDVK